MFLSGFKRKSILSRIDKKLSKSTNSVFSKDTKIDSILIFVDETVNENIDKMISLNLSVDISKVKLLVFKKKNDKHAVLENEIDESDFGLFGSIKTAKVGALINNEFDLLLNYSDDNLFLNYLALASKAEFKVSFADTDKRLYDLMIVDKEKKVSVFNSELKKYLKILNKI